MTKPEMPANEVERLAVLKRYEILDTPAESAFDDLVVIAAGICAMPIAAVSLIDADRQWFKASCGLAVSQTPRDVAFCAHAILTPADMMIVHDTHQDVRFRDNPLVNGDPKIRFYAGAPLLSADGHALGSFCVMDHEPRHLEAFQIDALNALSRQASRLLELHRVGGELRHHLAERSWYEKQLLFNQGQLEAENASLSEQTLTDPLTGLSNRRAFNVVLEQALANDRPACVAEIDIDHFKMINDLHGHPVGDAVIVAVANALRSASDGRGFVARYGGEEFVWLLPDTALDAAMIQCDYLREAVEYASQALPVTVSVGLAVRRDDDNAAAWFARADKALYQAKSAGRNRVVAVGR